MLVASVSLSQALLRAAGEWNPTVVSPTQAKFTSHTTKEQAGFDPLHLKS